MDKIYAELKDFDLLKTYVNEAAMRGVDALSFSSKFVPLYKALEADTIKIEEKNKIVSELIKQTMDFYKDFNLKTDQKLFAALIKMFYENISPDYHPTYFKTIAKSYKGNFEKFAEYAYNNSLLVSRERTLSLLDDLSYKKIDKDPIFENHVFYCWKF